jgi:hypothetical protein
MCVAFASVRVGAKLKGPTGPKRLGAGGKTLFGGRKGRSADVLKWRTIRLLVSEGHVADMVLIARDKQQVLCWVACSTSGNLETIFD